MHYYWEHFKAEQVIGDNIWRNAFVDHFGLASVLDISRGSFIIGDDVYIIGYNFEDEDYTINGKVYEDEFDIADEDFELVDGLTVEMLKPYIREGKDTVTYFPFDASKCDIDEIASDVVAEHDLIYSMRQLEDADISPYNFSIHWYGED